MSGPDWHKRFHAKALKGMAKLPLIERGFYQTVQDMIYENGGPIDDDEAYLSGQMMISRRLYRSIRDRLVDRGRISRDACGRLTDERCLDTLQAYETTRTAQSEGGRIGGLRSGETRAALSTKTRETSVKKSRKSSENEPKNSRKSSELEPVSNENSSLSEGTLGFSEPDTRARLLESKNRRDSLLFVGEGWSLDAAALEAGLAAGLPREAIAEESERHLRYWRAKGVRRTADEWRFSWDERVRAVAAKRGKPVAAAATKPAIIEAPLPTDGPVWWRAAAAKVAEADPVAWSTWWASCEPTNDSGVVIARSALVAERINSGQIGADAARVLGFEVRAVLLDQPRKAARA